MRKRESGLIGKHYVITHLQRALLLHAPFMGDWYKTGIHPPQASTQNGMTTHCLPLILLTDCSPNWQLLTWGWKLPTLYIFRTPTHTSFRHTTYTIHMAFLLSFAYLKTLVHILFWNPRPVKSQYVTQSCTQIEAHFAIVEVRPHGLWSLFIHWTKQNHSTKCIHIIRVHKSTVHLWSTQYFYTIRYWISTSTAIPLLRRWSPWHNS